ncbi:phosphatase PAP2 family protein [Amphritea sp. HPY]|uniref:phosphatase PAP2 family protein n=1 Tax=Amphritea sp. HPY TaxID=3421652 RepID=UPI003D7C9E91
MTSVDNSGWKPAVLIICNVAALLLFTSWLLEPTRSFWLYLDNQSFWAMNNSLAWGETWQKIWAIANNRAFDLVAAFAMLSLFAYPALISDRSNQRRYIAIFALAILTVLIFITIGKEIPVDRVSATTDYKDALRLSQLVPDIPTKDIASDSFPGDHGLVLFIFAGFACYYLSRAAGVLACLFMVAFALPRLMSGAHWLTDEIVGAVFLGTIALSWVFATPLGYKVVNWIEQKIPRWLKI